MLQNDFAPLWAVSLGVVVPLVAVVGVCICGCRKTVPKSSATVNRSLPAIPSDSERHRPGGEAIWENEPNGDTGSELYATVGDKQAEKHAAVPQIALQLGSGQQRLLTEDASLETSRDNESNMLSHGDDSVHYDCLKSEHPYDKVKKSEHPYAQVKTCDKTRSFINDAGSSGVNDCSSEAADPRTSGDRNGSGAAGAGDDECERGNPVPPPRTRRSTSSSAGAAVAAAVAGGAAAEAGAAAGAEVSAATDAATAAPVVASSSSAGTVPERACDIAAATAIAGRVAASQELPYMTPPIPQPANFSGDSQDSKGYTSISVREPLASIKAQTKVYNQSQAVEMQDPHYATVSDDSDEMYAAIEDPAPVYNSGSETYAQIQPLAPSEPLLSEQKVDSSVYPPQPPSVDSLKYVAHAHSRQASSSSASSSVANLGSPKPEKRQANSPLPPPPCGSPDKCADKPNLTVSEIVNIEEMYAKVMKKKHNMESNPSTSVMSQDVDHPSQNNECSKLHQEPDRLSISVSEIGAKCDSINSECNRTEGQLRTQDGSIVNSINSDMQLRNLSKSHQYFDPGYEVVHTHGVTDSSSTSENKAEPVPCEDDSYSHSCPSDSNTYNNNSSESNSTYSVRRLTNDSNNNNNSTENGIYPKYESVLPVGFAGDSTGNDSPFFSDEISEPNYESMPSEETELHYTGAQGTSGSSEVDPNYEVVEHDDPNYESVNYIESNSEPPYERLHNEVQDFESEIDHNYDSTMQCNNRTVENHEKSVAKSFNERERQTSEPGYEEIGQQNNKVWSELDPKERDGVSSFSSKEH
ncbi:hypothetical protein R5R35_013709 [Gryllus longicercus]|uniref:Uncharacterized protein n=1 Tax=Gryllus longicercus TaxID=2509291 RepID=A0AAN9WA87_9ORTH